MSRPEPYYVDADVTLYHADSVELLATLPDASVDSVVTDPPYGLEFMGKEWDGPKGFRRRANPNDVARENLFGRSSKTSPQYFAGSPFQAWCELWAAECLRVLKPGGYILAFGGSRTWHRLVVAVEDAGFEIRDSIAWLYGSGFPKSLDVSKAIDKAAGVERLPSGAPTSLACEFVRVGAACEGHGDGVETSQSGRTVHALPTAPATDAAKEWQGWGTALKPAFEPIVVGRKPLIGTVAENVLTHGTGAINVDGCRVPGEVPSVPQPVFGVRADGVTEFGAGVGRNGQMSSAPSGRWPTNVVLDESQAAALDEQSGVAAPKAERTGRKGGCNDNGSLIGYGSADDVGTWPADPGGGASRFFPTFKYEPKAPTIERPRVDEVAHATVKPLDLMRWLVRLVTPPGGVVLEPFAGSGTTAEACVIEGMRCIAIEREAEYLPLIVARITKPLQVAML